MSPRRVGALVLGNDPQGKTIWIVDAVDMDGEGSINRFIQNNPGCFGGLLEFIDIDEGKYSDQLDFEEHIRTIREIEFRAQKAVRKLFDSESRVIDLDMRIDGRKVRCCCALK